MAKSNVKERAAMFTASEQRLILETYEEFRHVITKKGNTAAINKIREKGWQEIADRLNAKNLSGERRTWQQVKTKYKNFVQNSAKKKSDVVCVGGGPPAAHLSRADELVLEQNQGRPVLEGIEQGRAFQSMAPSARTDFIKVMTNSVSLLEPPDIQDIILDPGEGPSIKEEDVDTVFVCSRGPEQDTETLQGSSRTGTTCNKNTENENVKMVYKRYLLKQIDALDTDIQYKRLKMRKLELEIQQLENNAASS